MYFEVILYYQLKKFTNISGSWHVFIYKVRSKKKKVFALSINLSTLRSFCVTSRCGVIWFDGLRLCIHFHIILGVFGFFQHIIVEIGLSNVDCFVSPDLNVYSAHIPVCFRFIFYLSCILHYVTLFFLSFNSFSYNRCLFIEYFII